MLARSALSLRASASPSAVASIRAMSAVAAAPSSTSIAQKTEEAKVAKMNKIRTTDNTVNILRTIPRTYESMSLEDRISVQDVLEEAQKADWRTMTLDEKKAAYYIAYGPYGCRRQRQTTETSRRVLYQLLFAGLACGTVWNILRCFRAPPAITSTHEYQALENEWMRERNMNPISGVSSEQGKKGDGMINHGLFPKSFP